MIKDDMTISYVAPQQQHGQREVLSCRKHDGNKQR